MRWSEIDEPVPGLNPAMCYHIGKDTNNIICGAMATNYLPLPGKIPDMPLCSKHWESYKMIDSDDLLSEIMKLFLNKEEDEDGTREY